MDIVRCRSLNVRMKINETSFLSSSLSNTIINQYVTRRVINLICKKLKKYNFRN